MARERRPEGALRIAQAVGMAPSGRSRPPRTRCAASCSAPRCDILANHPMPQPSLPQEEWLHPSPFTGASDVQCALDEVYTALPQPTKVGLFASRYMRRQLSHYYVPPLTASRTTLPRHAPLSHPDLATHHSHTLTRSPRSPLTEQRADVAVYAVRGPSSRAVCAPGACV